MWFHVSICFQELNPTMFRIICGHNVNPNKTVFPLWDSAQVWQGRRPRTLIDPEVQEWKEGRKCQQAVGFWPMCFSDFPIFCSNRFWFLLSPFVYLRLTDVLRWESIHQSFRSRWVVPSRSQQIGFKLGHPQDAEKCGAIVLFLLRWIWTSRMDRYSKYPAICG